MQLHNILYAPKKKDTPYRVEQLPLRRGTTRISSVLRALHPQHKLYKIIPLPEHVLTDTGNYQYYTVAFHYESTVYVGILGDDEASRSAGRAVNEASNTASLALLTCGFQHTHLYAWPDGSLIYVLRTERSKEKILEDLSFHLDEICKNPRTLRSVYVEDGKRRWYQSKYGTRKVTVSEIGLIENPWECDPHGSALNYVELFERKSDVFVDDGEDYRDDTHDAFRQGMQEAFGHQRLFHFRVKPHRENAKPASEEVCTAYVAGYGLGKVLLALQLPTGIGHKPWSFLKEANPDDTK